jgi:hypothetical protein
MDIEKPLSNAEKKRIRLLVEKEFERYRMFKSAGMIEGNSTYYSKEKIEEIQAYCMRIEKAVAKLPEVEKQLITERYLNIEGDYITDQQVYTDILNPPISERTYGKYRDRAVEKLVFLLDLECC